mgnify:CR=1 FL=1
MFQNFVLSISHDKFYVTHYLRNFILISMFIEPPFTLTSLVGVFDMFHVFATPGHTTPKIIFSAPPPPLEKYIPLQRNEEICEKYEKGVCGEYEGYDLFF